MAMRPPIDQTLWDSAGLNRGDYDSMFAPRPDMSGPGGANGMGFGGNPNASNMPVLGAEPPPILEQPNPQHRWDAQMPGAQGGSPALIQQLAKLLMGGSLPMGGGRFETMGGGGGGGPSGGGEG